MSDLTSARPPAAGHDAPLAVMTPAPQGWRGLATVRGTRLTVSADGGLRVVAPGQPMDGAILAPGAVDRVLLVDDPRGVGLRPSRHTVAEYDVDRYGVLVALAGRRPLLALRVGEWLPGAQRDLDGPGSMRASGADDLARALGGLIVERDDGSGVDGGRELRRVLVHALPRLPPWYRALVASVAAAALAVWTAWLASGSDARAEIDGLGAGPDALIGTGPAVALACLGAAQVLGAFALHRQAARLARGHPPVGEVVRPAPDRPVDRGFRDRARLELERDGVVVRDGAGREARLRGPAGGGVTSVAVAAEALVLRDAGGEPLAALDRSAWVGAAGAEERLSQACERAAIGVVPEPAGGPPGSFAGPHVLLPFVVPFMRRVEARGLPSVVLLLPALLTVGVILASDGSGLAAIVGGAALLAGAVRVLAAAAAAYRVNVTVPPRASDGAEPGRLLQM